MIQRRRSLEQPTRDALEAEVSSFLDELSVGPGDYAPGVKYALHVSCMSASMLQIELHFDTVYIPPIGGSVRSVRLFGIYVGEDFQRQGFGSSIIALLERYTEQQLAYLVIGPIFSEELAALIDKRADYQNTPPFSSFYNNPKYKIVC